MSENENTKQESSRWYLPLLLLGSAPGEGVSIATSRGEITAAQNPGGIPPAPPPPPGGGGGGGWGERENTAP